MHGSLKVVFFNQIWGKFNGDGIHWWKTEKNNDSLGDTKLKGIYNFFSILRAHILMRIAYHILN